jgi:hypothetical protein
MKPIDDLCHRVFADNPRLGYLRHFIERFDNGGGIVDDAIHDGIIAMVQEHGDSVFLMSQDTLFRILTRHAKRCHSVIQRLDVKHGLTAGRGKVKGMHFKYATSMFREDGSLKPFMVNFPSRIKSPERILLRREHKIENDALRKQAVVRILEIMREIIGDVDIDDIISIRDGYTTGSHGIGAGLADILGVHERTAQRRLHAFKQHLSEDELLQQLLKEIL